MAAALRGIDPAVEEVATSLGRSGWSVFTRVTLPAISPAVLGGALLVGLHLLAEYGALQLLNYPTLTTAILQQYATVFNGPEATLLALVLVTFCLLLLGIEAAAPRPPAARPGRLRRERSSRSGSVSAGSGCPSSPRWSASPCGRWPSRSARWSAG